MREEVPQLQGLHHMDRVAPLHFAKIGYHHEGKNKERLPVSSSVEAPYTDWILYCSNQFFQVLKFAPVLRIVQQSTHFLSSVDAHMLF